MKRPPNKDFVDRWTAYSLAVIGVLAGAVFDTVWLWVGYDLLAPLFHLPLANPLHALGVFLVLSVLITNVKGREHTL